MHWTVLALLSAIGVVLSVFSTFCCCTIKEQVYVCCRLLITGTMLACKFMDDRYFTNNYYAQVGGVSLQELNSLELELLCRLGYRAHVDVPELCACLQVCFKL